MSKKEKNLEITGRIINRITRTPLGGLRVEAWDKDLICNDQVGSCVTDAEGTFKIDFNEDYFKELFADRRPNLFFKVFQNGAVLQSTEDSILWNMEADPAEIVIEVGPARGEAFDVKGAVRLADGFPARGFIVAAFDRDLRREQRLGTTRTNKDGLYQIQYSASQFQTPEAGSADLVVKALADNGSLLAASPVLFNAPSSAVLDLTILATVLEPPALFDKIAFALGPLLSGVKVEELEENREHQDLSFISGETGFEKNELARFVFAHRLAQRQLPAEFWFVLLRGSFYQFTEDQSLKEQLAVALDALPSLDRKAVSKSLTRGFNKREISESLWDKAAGWIDAFLQFIANRSVSESVKPTFVKLALDHAGIGDPKKQETFACLFNEHKAVTPELLDALEKDPSFKQEEIADLRTSFRLAELTQGDFSVVKMVKEEFRVRQPEQVRKLARISKDDWVRLVQAKRAAGEIKLPIQVTNIAGVASLPEAEVYGSVLERQFREAFPTAAFAGGLERALRNGGARGVPRAETVSRFLDLHEDFEFLNTPVDDFLKADIHADFRELASDERFRLEVKAVQRVFKLAPSFEATDELLADDIHSAQQAYRVGKTEFVRRYSGRAGFTAESARRTWNRAADTHAAVLTIVADLKALESNSLPQALKNGNEALSTFPNWNNLFQTGDLCECEHCRSVISPAAYFADLLMFLKDRDAVPTGFTVKDVLFNRRPDLGYIELNCENALTPFPYVDTVCEVLEDVVDAAGENDLELTGLNAIPVDAVAAKTAVAQAFAGALSDPANDDKWKINLGENFSLSQVNSSDPDLWVVHSEDVTYLLKKKATPDFFAKILRNTKASADELRSYPQYVNPKAYEKLRAAKYPLSLPFDLFADEVRAAFKKTNLERWDLMRTLRGVAAPNNPTEGEIAAEYFGISTDSAGAFDEQRLIFVADTTVAGQQDVWGETESDWLTKVGNVKAFLEKTGLEYNDVLALLDLKFINPSGDIAILHLDPSCDTDQKVVEVLSAEVLDRIHRFLRFWRKLKGWKMWELDLVIRHPRIGNGALDESFLISLFYFNRLRSRLGNKATVEHTCALFGNLNTETRFTKLHEKRDDALYQKLFLNKRLINPLDPAFQFDSVSGELPAGETITAHHPVVLATLGLRETDLLLLKGLTKASDGTSYIDDDLTLSNLSFLWRHAWLSKLLKFKVADWKILLKVFQQDITHFANPVGALKFVEGVDQLKASGFAPDELGWLLGADLTAKAAIKETDAARFLSALRKELRGISAEYDQTQYDFLASPTDVDSLTPLLASLLQKLNRNEASAGAFLKTLRGGVRLEASVQELPSGFVFSAAITSAPNHIPIEYDETNQVLSFTGLLTETQRTLLLNDPSLAAVSGQSAYVNAIQELYQQSLGAATNYVSAEVEVLLPGGVTLPDDGPSLPIRYNSITSKLSFTGVMTDAERLALIAAGNPAPAIDELFLFPRMTVKFYEVVFIVPLVTLPPAVDFGAQLPADLAAKISYDAEQRLLRFTGIMSLAEQSALNTLAPSILPEEVAYHVAVNSLAAQPHTIVPLDERIWLADIDLDVTQPANDTLAKRLANAAAKALAYLSSTLVQNAVVQQSSAQLGLTESVTRYLLSNYAVLPDSLLAQFSGPFTASTGVVDYATFKPIFDGWYWLNRVATMLKKWKITLPELEKFRALTAGAQLLDFLTLPLDSAGTIASIERFLRTSRLLRLRDILPEGGTTLLQVLENLNSGIYDAEAASSPPSTAQQLFAADVQRLNEAWAPADVEALTDALDLAYPADYLLAENWERLRRVFYFLDNLNAGADTVKSFAAASMSAVQAQTLKELLRSKFGEETWLVLSAEIQDVLRERKRDGLAAYLLTHPLTDPMPVDAPTGKWENTNDLYAYYLLDVEMSSCQLTSRLVQGSGSIQLFVQRCFMGLEPGVVVEADGDSGDSAWRWWKWMRKYRVWEANRKVFLWPENWIEPELRKDKSQFFKDLEDELLQNDITQYTSETAIQNYLEKLDGVAQLEIAGFYHEDDGDEAIVHVFGRTRRAEPHLYYYRRYDYRQWTPWEKVELDIEGDYLIPAVVNKRLFLLWPLFTEVPDEEGNNKVTIPAVSTSAQPNTEVQKTKKRLRLKMAVSDYRQGKWTPKKVSTDFHESWWYDIEIAKKHYRFLAIDGSEVDGRFAVEYDGSGLGSDGVTTKATLSGAFEIAGCRGVPEQRSKLWDNFTPTVRAEEESTGLRTQLLKWVELATRDDNPEEDFTLQNYFPNLPSDYLYLTWILMQTPGIFTMTPPWHLSYFDKLIFDGKLGFPQDVHISRLPTPVGSWLPFFYNDRRRSFFVLPAWARQRDRRERKGSIAPKYYPEIKKLFRQFEDYFEDLVQTFLNTLDFSAMPPPTRQALEQFLSPRFPEMPKPPFTDQQVEDLMKRWFMRFFHWHMGLSSTQLQMQRRFHFKNFYHPFVCDLAKLVYDPLKGIPALMSRETQLKNSGFSFRQTYKPAFAVLEPQTDEFYPQEVVDFTPDGAYSAYNWELFFHVPLLIANSLSKNQRFEEAHEWYHFIFNPIGVESPVPGGSPMSKYWITKPFFETTDPQYIQQRIESIMRMLAGDTTVPGFSAQTKKDLEDQVLDWRTYPFEPHRIANYRTVAYQKTVVMRYLDNLIAWGDYLFRQDSMESINEATQLYILAAEVLGPRPQKIPPQAKPPVESFNELEDDLDAFSNALVEVENLIPPLPANEQDGEDLAPLPMLYFCIPQNEKLLSYWDTVADRLYKIRHCMNIEGVVRQLSLFEPPIDPAALVKAVVGGLDISSALADLNAPLPLYRFNVLLQRAKEVCSDVRSLGGALLSALEKKDAEALGLLRQTVEIDLLKAVKAVREKQIAEARENLEALKRSKATVEEKRDYYRLIEKVIDGEQQSLDQLERAQHHSSNAQTINIGASILGYIPNLTIGGSGFGGSPHVNAQWGTGNIISALQAASGAENQLSSLAAFQASRASTSASHTRRFSDWKLQETLADREMAQLDKQIDAANVRISIAEQELVNHNLQIENSQTVDEFMRSKYTNKDLYQWHIGQISAVYFKSYKLAYDLAKRAEKCFRFELGLQDSSFINFGYWDSLKKGLLSGEKLQYDLHRLETALLEKNRREFELTKHVSVALLDPLALVRLRETGKCFFRLPEEIFDLDFPGHYFRRIKSVSLTLPCVVGPFTTISSTLRLLKNSIRINTANGDNGYAHNADDQGPTDDLRFVENNVGVKAIAASSAQNDSGMFELNFRDERYLPFEGAGAVSEWSLELFSDPADPDFGKPLRQFDYGTISDAIVHIKYTAREDAGPFKNGAVQNLRTYFSEDGTMRSLRLFNLRQEFPGQWHRFLNPTNPVDGNVFEFEMLPALFPLKDVDKTLKINAVWLLARCTDPGTYSVLLNPPLLPPPPPGSDVMTLAKINQYGGLHFGQKNVSESDISVAPTDPPLQWVLKMTRPGGQNLEKDPLTNEMEVEDLMLMVGYDWET